MVCRLFVIKLVVFFLFSKTNSHLFVNPFLSYFENIAHVSGVSVCIFVALYVWMFVAGANKVEGSLAEFMRRNQ